MKQYLKSLEKKGVFIEDRRHVGLGVKVVKQEFKYISITNESMFHRDGDFHINIWSTGTLSVEDAVAYSLELRLAISICNKINTIINQNKIV